MGITNILKSIVWFIVAGFCEIAGGYFVWIWVKESKSFWYAIMGMCLLILYGFIPTLQPSNFGRVYAAYGGVFVILSII